MNSIDIIAVSSRRCCVKLETVPVPTDFLVLHDELDSGPA